MILSWSALKMHQLGVTPCVSEKLYKPDHPNTQSPIRAIVNVRTNKHDNFKADAADPDIDRFC